MAMKFDRYLYKWRKFLAPILSLLHPEFAVCGRCKMPLSNITSHTTRLQSSGILPLCISCWEELETPEARLPYYKQLWLLWHRSGVPREKWEDIETAVMNETETNDHITEV